MRLRDDDRVYVEQLVEDYYGDRLADLPPERLLALRDLFGEIMWHEGIEALTPERLDGLLAFTAQRLPDAA